ncbi:hypothetical protein P154DRAFT_609525 [Amniculicola lignicola CBS 123094]|uniref:Uncharacterized protein n=1 Tax=Amniculicola lignicola CBS 123094 TaxID=1392246 RepID=A0A6A5WEE8_9PLEO|nr:hypothetical protein P154DRAFT_609525 [Amniculicola lignicola CBS 123094]
MELPTPTGNELSLARQLAEAESTLANLTSENTRLELEVLDFKMQKDAQQKARCALLNDFLDKVQMKFQGNYNPQFQVQDKIDRLQKQNNILVAGNDDLLELLNNDQESLYRRMIAEFDKLLQELSAKNNLIKNIEEERSAWTKKMVDVTDIFVKENAEAWGACHLLTQQLLAMVEKCETQDGPPDNSTTNFKGIEENGSEDLPDNIYSREDTFDSNNEFFTLSTPQDSVITSTDENITLVSRRRRRNHVHHPSPATRSRLSRASKHPQAATPVIPTPNSSAMSRNLVIRTRRLDRDTPGHDAMDID